VPHDEPRECRAWWSAATRIHHRLVVLTATRFIFAQFGVPAARVTAIFRWAWKSASGRFPAEEWPPDARRRHGVAASAEAVLVVGTIEPRKRTSRTSA
jgi:hypothetical protein